MTLTLCPNFIWVCHSFLTAACCYSNTPPGAKLGLCRSTIYSKFFIGGPPNIPGFPNFLKFSQIFSNFPNFLKFSNAHLGLALCCCSSSRHRLTAEPLLSNSPRCFGKANRHHHHQIGHHYPLRPKKTNFPKLAQNNVKFFLLPSTTRYQCVLP